MEELRAQHGRRQFLARKDSVTIWPRGHELVSLGWSGTGLGEIIDVEIFSNAYQYAVDQDFRYVDLAAQRGIQDPHLAALVFAMRQKLLLGAHLDDCMEKRSRLLSQRIW